MKRVYYVRNDPLVTLNILLLFYPHFYMDDLPCTSSRHAIEAAEAARAAGLSNVRLGNVQLLSNH